jgi:hypothetical protein
MVLTKLPPDKTNESSANEPQSAPGNSERREKIKVPPSQGGKWRLTNKLRKEGILAPGQTIRQYNEAIDLNSGASSQANNDPGGAVEVEIESHGETSEPGGFGGLLSRATNALRDNDAPKKSAKVAKSSREDFAVLVVSVVTLLVTFAKIDERVKPNGEEINLFCEPFARILLRHLPINNKLSADALDIIGMMAATAGWYARVHDVIPASREAAPRAEARAEEAARSNGHLSPIEAVSPETGQWLDRIAANSGGMA